MSITITDDTFIAYSHCPRKAYNLLYTTERGEPHEYCQILEQNRIANLRKFIDRSIQAKSNISPYNIENIRRGCETLTSATLIAQKLQAHCDVLTRVSKQYYEPTLIIGSTTISTSDKLRLMFIGHVLSKVQGRDAVHGHIISMANKPTSIKLQHNQNKLRAVLEPLQSWSSSASAPPEPTIILNKHCSLCQFLKSCETEATQEDNLSRLQGVTAKIIRRFERKGIFSVKQLSYTFKPRKHRRHARNNSSAMHKVELQALAIRTSKTYIQALPTLTRNEVELFLDIESLPDQNTHYLFGILKCMRGVVTYQPFWGNTPDDERSIWLALLIFLNQYPDAPIYHYGCGSRPQ